jgi:hypothetical protein
VHLSRPYRHRDCRTLPDTSVCRTSPWRDRRSLALAVASCHDVAKPTAPVTRPPSRTCTVKHPPGATATGQPLDTSAFLRAEQALVADEGQPATTDCRNLGQGSPALHTKRQHGRSDTHKTAHDPIWFTLAKMSSFGCIGGAPRGRTSQLHRRGARLGRGRARWPLPVSRKLILIVACRPVVVCVGREVTASGAQRLVAAGGRLSDWSRCGRSVPRDAVDDAIAGAGRQAAVGWEAVGWGAAAACGGGRC